MLIGVSPLRLCVLCFVIFYYFLSCATATGALPGIDFSYGISPKFVCTPIPPEADPSCYSPPTVPHGPSSSTHSDGNWRGMMSDEAKATILHLRESLVRQKETILDQRETIRELTAKLTVCEGFGGHHSPGHHNSHHDDHRDNHEGHSKQGSFSLEQTSKMLQTLKERLESLQARNSSSSYSSSLKELLERKISTLEEQLHAYYRDHRENSHRKQRTSSSFLLDFPMRTNYMYGRMKKKLLKEIFALTICLRMKAGAESGLGTPFSYAVPGQSNELVLMEWSSDPLQLLVNNEAATLPVTLTDQRWHHMCVTWSTGDGAWEVFQDGEKKGSGQNLSAWHTIRPGGIFILGQEQDIMGGHFDVTQSFSGEMADLQFWSTVLTPDQIRSQASCAGHLLGDVLSWSQESVELLGGLRQFPFEPCH
uniref:Si:dkey-14o18.2 n=1 Tax=Cynoglossus semilaevis TaxID=244447 RepID=A0A3P8WI96_CYNSE